MPKEINITCDNCGCDLNTTTNRIAYRLALINERIPCVDGVITDVGWGQEPIIKQDAYFCKIKCFLQWVRKKYKHIKL